MTKKSNSLSKKVCAVKSDKIVIFEQNHKFWTTSADIAEKFKKRHNNVMQAIRNLECSDQFSQLNFKQSKYIKRGKEYNCFFITKDGLAFLAMGFTGKEAATWKEKYINAFNYLIEENEKLRKQIDRHKKDNEWLALRDSNKWRNKDFNEMIGEFQKYAEMSGSQNANRYFSLFNDMVNHNLFTFPKGLKNIPDRLEAYQLSFSDSTKKIIMELIRVGIEKSIHYKEIFIQCKEKVLQIANVLGVTPVPVIAEAQYSLLT